MVEDSSTGSEATFSVMLLHAHTQVHQIYNMLCVKALTHCCVSHLDHLFIHPLVPKWPFSTDESQETYDLICGQPQMEED